MSRGSNAHKIQRTTDGDQECPFSALPEDLLHHILSFLPSRDLVQKTCLIARLWRSRWKSVPALRISENTAFQNSDEMTKFMNRLIALRGHYPLVECEINFWHSDETYSYIDPWIRYVMLCHVQVLRIISDVHEVYCPLPDVLLVSDHLTTLELHRVESEKPLLDFSSCSALQDLNLSYSNLRVAQILSPTVKKLTIHNCEFPWNARTHISVPSLNILDLVVDRSLIPLLDGMPQLVWASISHEAYYSDCCSSRFEVGGCADASCDGCTHTMEEGKISVLLEVLSRATFLELVACVVQMFIFRRDLTLGPVFGKLKTLVVDDWCIVANGDALIFFLQHSPALEKLILLISEDDDYEVDYEVAKKAKYEGTKESSMSFNQLTVEVECRRISEKVKKILKTLVTSGVPTGQININVCRVARLAGKLIEERHRYLASDMVEISTYLKDWKLGEDREQEKIDNLDLE